MQLVAQRVVPGGKAAEGSSAMDALRASKGKAKILVSEVRSLRASNRRTQLTMTLRLPAPSAMTSKRFA